jgi:hypothetical protein
VQGFGSVETFNSSVMAVANPSSKGVTVQKVLLDMFQAGLFDVPLYLGRETAKMCNVLELVGVVVTPEKKVYLANKESTVKTIKDICKGLEDRAMAKILDLEKGQGSHPIWKKSG